MKQKQDIRITLLVGLWLLTLGGWGLHYFIHPPAQETKNMIPFIAGLISVVGVPLLFFFQRTAAFGYVINGMLAVIGTITMAKFKLFPDILILWAQFLMGKALFDLQLLKNEDAPRSHGRFWRYPNMGWWWVHAGAMAAVFLLGYLLWI